MRAVCAACAQAQPPDWRPGDLCTHCGQAVRHDRRCFWCAKWVPVARFCRACGAETVPEARYGAARMLKDAGVDRFAVPKKLTELDAEQLDNFTRIYQRQAVVVARHVDDLRFLERFLRQRHWSGELEDQLIPQLPWPKETLAAFTVSPLPAGDAPCAAESAEAKHHAEERCRQKWGKRCARGLGHVSTPAALSAKAHARSRSARAQ